MHEYNYYVKDNNQNYMDINIQVPILIIKITHVDKYIWNDLMLELEGIIMCVAGYMGP